MPATGGGGGLPPGVTSAAERPGELRYAVPDGSVAGDIAYSGSGYYTGVLSAHVVGYASDADLLEIGPWGLQYEDPPFRLRIDPYGAVWDKTDDPSYVGVSINDNGSIVTKSFLATAGIGLYGFNPTATAPRTLPQATITAITDANARTAVQAVADALADMGALTLT